MEPSVELCEVVRRLYNALEKGDADTVASLCSDSSAGILVIGADEDEWYEGSEDWTERGIPKILGDVTGACWREQALRAWTEGSLGFAVDRPLVEYAGASTELRGAWSREMNVTLAAPRSRLFVRQ